MQTGKNGQIYISAKQNQEIKEEKDNYIKHEIHYGKVSEASIYKWH